MHIPDDEKVYLDADEPPRSGAWVDPHDVLGKMTPEEIDAGERLSQLIDTDDDDDNGLLYIGGPSR
jgi:hypothetical protein